MTQKILAALGAACILFATPALAAPRNEHEPPAAHSPERGAAPPAYRAPQQPYGAAAARRARILGHEDVARQPGQFRGRAMMQAPLAPTSGARRGPEPSSRAWNRDHARPQRTAVDHRPRPGYAHSVRPNLAPSSTGGAFGHPQNFGQRGLNRGALGQGARPNVRTWIPRSQATSPDYAHQRHDFADHNRRNANERQHPPFDRHPRPDHNGRRDRFDHRDAGHYWERGWERDYRSVRRYHWRPYIRPRGWYAQRWRFGMYLPYLFWTRNYWIDNYWTFGLPQPPYGYAWVREGNDALLINEQDGYILQVVYGVFY